MSAEPPARRAQSVSAIVVAHNSGATLARAVAGLDAAEVGEIIIVDNASSDGAPQALVAPVRSALKRVSMAGNVGFGAGCNAGAAQAQGTWLAFVNPDCFVAPDTFERLLAAAQRAPQVGLLGADVRDADGAPEPAARRRAPNLVRLLGGLVRSRRPNRRLFVAPGAAGAITIVDASSGALMLLPSALFKQLGGFEPAYTLHAEDLDLCRRVQQAGYAVAVAEGVAVTHLKGTSSKSRPLFVAWHKHRGLIRYLGSDPQQPASSRRAAQALVALAFAARLPLSALQALRARAYRDSGL